MVRRKVVVLFMVVGLIIGGAIGGYAMIHEPHMEYALYHHIEAKAQLEMAEHDKGGHRVDAIKLINLAIAEVKKSIGAGEKD